MLGATHRWIAMTQIGQGRAGGIAKFRSSIDRPIDLIQVAAAPEAPSFVTFGIFSAFVVSLVNLRRRRLPGV
jgi:hypothetical protein